MICWPNPDPETLRCMGCGRPLYETANGWRHDRPRCGALMRNTGDICNRFAGHADSHRRRLVMDDDNARRRAA